MRSLLHAGRGAGARLALLGLQPDMPNHRKDFKRLRLLGQAPLLVDVKPVPAAQLSAQLQGQIAGARAAHLTLHSFLPAACSTTP